LNHTEFVSAYREGRITVQFDPTRAAQLLSARLLLPVMTLPVLGLGVGLALIGWLWTGLIVIALGFIVPRLIKRSAPHFLLTQMLEDAQEYDAICKANVMQLVGNTQTTHESPGV
jgi:hypothetical protein